MGTLKCTFLVPQFITKNHTLVLFQLPEAMPEAPREDLFLLCAAHGSRFTCPSKISPVATHKALPKAPSTLALRLANAIFPAGCHWCLKWLTSSPWD